MKEIKIIHRYDTDFVACIDNDGDIIISSINTLLENIDNENLELVTVKSDDKLIEDYIQACIELKSIRKKIQEKYEMNCEEFHLKLEDILPCTGDNPGKDGVDAKCMFDSMNAFVKGSLTLKERVPDAGETKECNEEKTYYKCFFKEENGPSSYYRIHFGDTEKLITRKSIVEILDYLKRYPFCYIDSKEQCERYIGNIKRTVGTDHTIFTEDHKWYVNELSQVSVYCPEDEKIYTISDLTGEVKLLTWTENGKHHAYCHELGYTLQNWYTESKMIDSFNESLKSKDYGDIIISTLKSKQKPIPTYIPKRAIQRIVSLHDKKVSN